MAARSRVLADISVRRSLFRDPSIPWISMARNRSHAGRGGGSLPRATCDRDQLFRIYLFPFLSFFFLLRTLGRLTGICFRTAAFRLSRDRRTRITCERSSLVIRNSRIGRGTFGNIGPGVTLFNRIVRNAHMFLG